MQNEKLVRVIKGLIQIFVFLKNFNINDFLCFSEYETLNQKMGTLRDQEVYEDHLKGVPGVRGISKGCPRSLQIPTNEEYK